MGRELGFAQAQLSEGLCVCPRADTLVGPTLVSSLCIDRFVGTAVKATGVRQKKKNKESWLIDEV